MDDILSRPRALKTLIAIQEAQPMNMRGFMEACGYISKPANELLDDLLEWGLVKVKETGQGVVVIKEISLTPAGEEVCELAKKLRDRALALKDRAAHSSSRT